MEFSRHVYLLYFLGCWLFVQGQNSTKVRQVDRRGRRPTGTLTDEEIVIARIIENQSDMELNGNQDGIDMKFRKQRRPVHTPKQFPSYKPRGQTLQQWTSNHGLSQREYRLVSRAISQMKRADSLAAGRRPSLAERRQSSNIYSGVAWTLADLRAYKPLSRSPGRRSRRALYNFDTNRSRMWPRATINYVLDGTQSTDDLIMIQGAMAEWAKHTCIRFEESSDGDHLYFQTQAGCWSYVGRQRRGAQPLNLQTRGCTSWLGGVVHEIGHALGIFHEQSRPDRDSYVNINTGNIRGGLLGNFNKFSTRTINSRTLEYDYGSVMHYGSGDFSSNNLLTIETLDSGHQRTLGQRVGLSWHDAYGINLAYCSDTCDADPAPVPVCANGGYQDPNNCAVCRCPEGLGGDLCEKAKPSDGGCTPDASGEYKATASPQFIQSRNYGSGTFDVGDECNYLISAPEGCAIDVEFVGDTFGMYCYRSSSFPACFEWLEIKTGVDLSSRGYRFCCRDGIPSTKLTSDSNTVVVHFNGQYPIVANSYTSGIFPESQWRRGWKISYKIADPTCVRDTTTTTDSAPPTTTVSTEPPTPPPTTTPTPPPSTSPPTSSTTPAPTKCSYYCMRGYWRCGSRSPCYLYKCCTTAGARSCEYTARYCCDFSRGRCYRA